MRLGKYIMEQEKIFDKKLNQKNYIDILYPLRLYLIQVKNGKMSFTKKNKPRMVKTCRDYLCLI
jgi:hypothetical protein